MTKNKKRVSTFTKGAVIGGSMVVPGVSGGTMAMLLGIYNELIYSINEITRKKFDRLPFLITFILGAGTGILILAYPISKMLELYPKPTLYFFMGAVLGGFPLMVKEAKITKFNWKIPVCTIAGLAMVLSLELLPENLLSVDLSNGIGGYIVLFIAGIVIAVALILPGISTTFMLLVLGIYEKTFKAVYTLDFKFLLPIVIGCVIGVFLTTGILEKLLETYPQGTYLVIIGFVLGSLLEIRPGFPVGGEIPICFALFFISAFLLNKLTRVGGEQQ